MPPRFRTITLLSAVILLSTPLPAQQRAPFSIDASIGAGHGYGGGNRVDRNGYALDALLAWRARPLTGGGLLLGVSGGIHAPHGGDAICALDSDGRCIAGYPRITGAGVLTGWERARKRGASLRMLAGPGYHRVNGSGGALGLQGRVEVATPPWARVSLVGSLRAIYLPSYRGDSYLLRALGIGIRVR